MARLNTKLTHTVWKTVIGKNAWAGRSDGKTLCASLKALSGKDETSTAWRVVEDTLRLWQLHNPNPEPRLEAALCVKGLRASPIVGLSFSNGARGKMPKDAEKYKIPHVTEAWDVLTGTHGVGKKCAAKSKAVSRRLKKYGRTGRCKKYEGPDALLMSDLMSVFD